MWVTLFVLTTILVFLLLSLAGPDREETPRDRLDRLVTKRRAASQEASAALLTAAVEAGDERRGFGAIRDSIREVLVGAVEKATSHSSLSSKLETQLIRADWRWKPAEFLIAQAVSSGGGLLLALLVAEGLWWLFAVVGWAIPAVMLRRGIMKRQRIISNQLPDGLAMIANALRSGYSFLQAMDVVSREMPPPISKEFALVLKEARVNIPLEEALMHMVERVQSPDLDLVVTAVLIQRQVGGNLSEVLEKIGGTVKDRIKLHGEIRSLTSQGRISGLVVGLLPVVLAVMMMVLSPSFLTPLFTHPLGRVMLVIGVVSQGLGIFVIRRMINMEV